MTANPFEILKNSVFTDLSFEGRSDAFIQNGAHKTARAGREALTSSAPVAPQTTDSTAEAVRPARAEPPRSEPVRRETAMNDPVFAAPVAKVAVERIVLPAQFQPIIIPGVLSLQQRQRAARHDSTAHEASPDSNSAFKVGLTNTGKDGLIRFQQQSRDELEDQHHQDEEDLDDTRDLLISAAFAQSAAYNVAVETVNRTFGRLRDRFRALSGDCDRYSTTERDAARQVEQLSVAEGNKVVRIAGLNGLKDARDQHMQVATEANAALAEEQRQKAAEESLTRVNVYRSGDDTYFHEINAQGNSTVYKLGADGKTSKMNFDEMPADVHCMLPKSTYMRKSADGTIEYIDHRGDKLDQDQTDKMNAYLTATGQRAEDVMASYDDFKKAVEAPDRVAAEKVASQKLDAAVESEKRLQKIAESMGIPTYKLHDLNDMLTAENTELTELRTQKDAALRRQNLSAAERQKAEAELASVDAEIKKTQDFKDRLQTGGFRNEREMLAAMPESMRADYQQTMAQKGTDNTARVNGSAVESGISARANLGAQFSSAAPGTKLTPATADDLSVAAPDTPAANHYRYQPGGLQPSFGAKLG